VVRLPGRPRVERGGRKIMLWVFRAEGDTRTSMHSDLRLSCGKVKKARLFTSGRHPHGENAVGRTEKTAWIAADLK
jgi:hypothetical protein